MKCEMAMKTPYYLIDEAALERNLKVLASVRKRAGVKILLAQKAFSAFDTYPLVAKYLDGTTASGLYEARLAHEEMPTRENHVFNPAFTDDEPGHGCPVQEAAHSQGGAPAHLRGVSHPAGNDSRG